MLLEIISKLLTGRPEWTIKALEGERNPAASQTGRPAMRQLLSFLNCGKPLHTVKHPEDSLLAFPCTGFSFFR